MNFFKVYATIDPITLTRSVRKEARLFGESTRAAVCRMGLQGARELAGNTQAFGKSWKKTQEIQRKAIMEDCFNIFRPYSFSARPKNPLSVSQAIKIWQENTKGSGKRTRPLEEKIPITKEVLWSILEIKFKLAGMAKSAWVGSARHLENEQGKGQQIRFGKAYSKQLRQWERLGRGTMPKGIWKPTVTLENTVAHTGKSYVLSPAKIRNAQKWAIKKTLKWYEKATTANLAKNKPKI